MVKFRAGIRIGSDGKGGGVEKAFVEDFYSSREKAIEESRNLVRGELTADAERFADKMTGGK